MNRETQSLVIDAFLPRFCIRTIHLVVLPKN